jgi:hypothetical protein
LGDKSILRNICGAPHLDGETVGSTSLNRSLFRQRMSIGGLLFELFQLLANKAEHLIGLLATTLHLVKLTTHNLELFRGVDSVSDVGSGNDSRQQHKELIPSTGLAPRLLHSRPVAHFCRPGI